MGERAPAVQLVDVFDADESGHATVAVYDELAARALDVPVRFVPDLEIVEIAEVETPAHVALFIERSRVIRELVALHFRRAVEAYDPR